jgi:signal transduction histidine kinase
MEGWWRKKDGSAFWADISSSAIFSYGEHSGYMVIAHDLTEKKRFEEERFKAVLQVELERKRTEDAKKQEKLQRDFTDRICHEVRNPLNGIYGSVELIVENLKKIEWSLLERAQRASSGSPTREADLHTVHLIKGGVETIAECSEYQRMITDEVLHLSSLEHQGLVFSNVAYSPRSVMDSVVQMYRATCEKKGVQLEAEYSSNAPGTVTGDKGYVQQVLTNLGKVLPSYFLRFLRSTFLPRFTFAVSNAIKFTPSGGTVQLEIEKVSVADSDYLRYSVRDTGIGMSNEDMDRLFQRAAHGKSTGYQERPGSGLGERAGCRER